MTKTELNELMEKAKAATPGPWYASIGSDEDGEFSTVGPAYLGDSLQNILNNAVCYLKPDSIQSNCNNIYIAAANPKVVLDLCERVIGLTEALKYYSDEQEWFDYKAFGLASDGEFCRVDSKFDHDSHGETARHALERFGVKNDTQ